MANDLANSQLSGSGNPAATAVHVERLPYPYQRRILPHRTASCKSTLTPSSSPTARGNNGGGDEDPFGGHAEGVV